MFKQFFAITAMGLQTLPQRLGSSSVIVIGIAGVVGVLISVMAMSIGFRHTLADAGRVDRAIILRGGSDAELNSNLTRTDVDTISNAPGILKDAHGQAALSRELVSVANIARIDTGTDSNVSLRGVSGTLLAVRPELTIVAGRMFRPAVRELIAGAGAAQQFRGLTPGSIVRMRSADWTVTGVFTSNGDAHESELMADVDTLGSTLERTGYSSAVALLTGADAVPGVQGRAHHGPAAQSGRAAREGLLRQAGGDVELDPDRGGQLGGHHHGHRRHVRRAQQPVLGGRGPRQGDRDLARHRLRRPCRCCCRSWSSRWPCRCSAG